MKSITKIDRNTIVVDGQTYKKVFKKFSKEDNRIKPPTLVYVKWSYDSMSLGQTIKTERVRKQLTQQELANKLNISKQYISLLEVNKKVSYTLLMNVLNELNLIIGVE
jgi:DNA-binding XRE family transcriptional regulator